MQEDNDILSGFAEVLEKVAKVDRTEITRDKRLRDDFGIDSLSMMMWPSQPRTRSASCFQMRMSSGSRPSATLSTTFNKPELPYEAPPSLAQVARPGIFHPAGIV